MKKKYFFKNETVHKKVEKKNIAAEIFYPKTQTAIKKVEKNMLKISFLRYRIEIPNCDKKG